jgi:hypothetical protein
MASNRSLPTHDERCVEAALAGADGAVNVILDVDKFCEEVLQKISIRSRVHQDESPRHGQHAHVECIGLPDWRPRVSQIRFGAKLNITIN